MVFVRKISRKLVFAILSCSVLLSLSMHALAEFDRGEALYDNHCRTCHENWVHTRENSKINTIDELRRRVAGWSIHSGLKWGNGEIDDVTAYLNRHYYQLTAAP